MMFVVTVQNKYQHEQKRFTCDPIFVGASDASGDNQNDDRQFLGVQDDRFPSMQLSLRPLPVEDGERAKVELTNHGKSIALSSGPRIHRGRVVEISLPFSFRVCETQIQVFEPERVECFESSLAYLTTQDHGKALAPGASTLAAWLETLSDLQQAVAGSQELFELAAHSVFNPGGLDGGMVLVASPEGWQIVASYIPYPDHGIGFNEELVAQAAGLNQVVYQSTDLLSETDQKNSLHSAVVCPVIGTRKEEVLAVVYGFRSLHRRNNRRGIRNLEAQFVKVVADSISAGMVRLDSEANATRSKVLLEQVFSPGVARHLQSNSALLEGQQREVSVLFADLRGFSEIADRLGPQATYELLSDIMDRFSQIIGDLDGTIIDFYGDGISAFWNAPFPQPEHAQLACTAGLEILASLPEFGDVWGDRIGQELKAGVGVHTGVARVGNSGSRTRLKYGPCGSTVNIASRLENATKRVGVPMLVSGEMVRSIDSKWPVRHLGSETLKGISSPTELYQVFSESEELPPKSCLIRYQTALENIEAGDWEQAKNTLEVLVKLHPEDAPASYLLARTDSKLKQIPSRVESVSNPEQTAVVQEELHLENLTEIVSEMSGVAQSPPAQESRDEQESENPNANPMLRKKVKTIPLY